MSEGVELAAVRLCEPEKVRVVVHEARPLGAAERSVLGARNEVNLDVVLLLGALSQLGIVDECVIVRIAGASRLDLPFRLAELARSTPHGIGH